MRCDRLYLAVLLAAIVALAPVASWARLGGGSSFGSRGSQTYSAPPPTNTAPFSAAPMQRSLTPYQSPNYGAPSPGLQGGFGGAYGGRSAFSSGLLGGLLGAGIGGLLFGGGLFGGMHGGGSLLGLLLQLALLYFVGRWIYRTFFSGQAMFAGGVRGGGSLPGGVPGAAAFGGRRGRAGPPTIAIQPADYQAFEALLTGMQAAWSAQDLNALRAVATPEMTSYFGEQLAEMRSRGWRNIVSDVQLLKGDLAQAWSEGGREYATVAMQFYMVDVTRDGDGREVDGSPTERQLVTELWTFMRSPGGRWLLSAIQQAR